MLLARPVPILLALVLTLDPCRALEPAASGAAGSDEVRVFVALPVPDAVADPHVAQQDRLRKKGFRFSRSSREELHLTLLFIGEIPSGKLPALRRALAGVASRTPCFDLQHRGLGYFTKGEDAAPFVIWGGCGKGFKGLADLADAISAASGKVGLPPRRGAFRAHVTLGRPTDPSQADALKKDLDAHRDLELGKEHVDRFVLLRTVRDGSSPSYETLDVFELKERSH